MKNGELLRLLRLLREHLRPAPSDRVGMGGSTDWSWWLEEPQTPTAGKGRESARRRRSTKTSDARKPQPPAEH